MAFGAKVKLSVNKTGARNFRNEIQKFVDDSTASNPIRVKNIKLELNKSQQAQLRRNIQNYLNTSGDNLTIKINKIDASGAVKQLRSQLETMLSGLSITGLKDFLGTEGVGTTYERAAVAAEKLATAQENVRRKSEEVNASVRVLKTLQNNATSAYVHGNKITDAEQVTKITTDYQLLCTQIEKTKNLEGEEQQIAIQGIVQKTAALRAYIDEIYETQAANKRATAEEEKNNQVVIASLQKVNTLYKKLSTYAKNNPRVMSDGLMGGQINSWMSQLASGTGLTEDDLRSMENGFAAIAMRAKEAGLEGKTFGDRVAAAYKKFGGWTIITRTLTFAIQKFKQMISIVTELDTAMTELRKVTNLTDKAYDELFDRAVVRAKQLGATVTDTITATADFARLGYGVEDAEKLADAAIVYKNVGDGIEDITSASESIISTLKAFGDETLSAMDIVDKFNEVGNNFAISSKGVGDALMRSSAALAAAGNTIDESIALAVGMNSVIQDPEKVGTVLKTASMYLRAAKTEAEDAGESTEGMANSVSELRNELLKLTKGKVDIMLDDTTFKSTIQIYRELAAVWKDLADVDAANILELIGGKRNATANAALLANFEDAEAALITSANSAGSALAENEKFLASIQGRLDVFKATFEEFSASFIDTNLVNFVLSLGTALLNILTGLDKLHLLLPAITMSITLLAARKKALQLQESASMVNTLASAITKEKAVTDTLSTSVAFLTTKEKALLISKIEEAAASGLITAEQKAQILSTLGLATAEGTLTVANKTLGASFKSLMASIPVWGWIALGVSAVIEIIMPLIDSINQSKKSIEDLNSEWEELSNTIQNSANSFQSMKKEADDIIPKYIKLAQGVDKYGKNVSLTDEEFAEFVSLNNKLGEMFPELVQGYDANGNAILALSGDVDTLTESLYNCVEAQRLASAKEIADTMPDVMSNINDTVSGYQKEIDKINDYKSELEELYDFLKSNNTFTEWVYGYYSKSEKEELLKKYGIEYSRKIIGSSGKDEQNTQYEFTVDWDKFETSYNGLIAGYDKQIDDFVNRTESKFKQLNPVVSAWLSTDFLFQDVEDEAQQIITKMIGGIDFKSLGLTTAEDVQNYIRNNIISPIYDMDDDAKEAFFELLDVEQAAASGELTAQEYIDKINGIINSSALSDTTKNYLRIAFQVDTEGIPEKINHVKALLSDEFDDMANSLTLDELEIAYKIVAEDGSLTFSQLEKKIDEIKNQNLTIPIGSWSDLGTIFDTYTEKMAGLATIQEAVRNGFVISADAAREFAKTYPEILQYATSAGNGQVRLNADVVNNFLAGKKAELQGSIDSQIAQLEAEKAALEGKKASAEAQLELAKQVGEGEGKISADVAAYRIDCGNIMTQALIDQGIDEATAFKLAAAAMAGNVDEFNRIAAEVCTDVDGNFDEAAYSAAQAIYNNMHNGKLSVAAFAKQCHEAAKAMAGVASGDVQGSSEVQGGGAGGTNNGDIKITLHEGNFKGSDYTYEAKEFSLDEFISDLELDISNYTSKIAEIDGQIAVLQALRNKPIEQFHPDYGSNTGGDKDGSDKTKEIEEYIADVERYTEALQKLRDAEVKQSQLERELENADGAFEKVGIQKKLNEAYKERQTALHELNNLRDTTISNAIPELEALGFQIEYNADTNRLYIANLEHLNELQAESAGEYETVQEATNALRKETEELIDDITGLNEENQEGSETWLDLADAINEGKDNIVELLNEAVTEAIDFVSAMQDVYSTLQEAADEYAESGSITVDTLKAIAEYGAEYMAYLKDENGQLVINKDRINDVVAARTRQLAVDTALSYVEKIRDALNENKVEELNRLITATEQASDATWGLVYSNLALLDLDDSQYKSALDNVNKLRTLADSAVQSIYSQADEDSTSAMENKQDALDTILDLTMELIQYEKEQEVEALENQIERYQKIIELKKESLNSSKEESDYNKEVASKVKEIAELQARINQLSLDDSREAQVERKSLEEELSTLQTDLADYQADYSLEKQTEALDDELEAYEETKNEEIKIVEDSISSTEKLYQLTIDRITNDWDNLYDDIIAWNYDAGSTIESEIVSAWELASKAVQEYGSYLEAVNAIAAGETSDNIIVSDSANYGDPKSIINQMKSNSMKWLISDSNTQGDLNVKNADLARQLSSIYGEDIYYDDGSWHRANGDTLYSIDKWAAVDYITQAMYRNSQAWSGASETGRANLEAANVKMAGYIEDLTGQTVQIKNGVWYIGDDELYKSYGFIYHNGGVVGGTGGVKDNEVLALLEKGELVLNQQKKDSLYKYMDISTYMMEKFGAAINNLSAVSSINPQLLANGLGNLEDKTGTLSSISGRSTNYVIESIQVTAPIQVLQKLDEDDIREYSRTIGDISAKYIQEGFTRKGITPNTTLF